MAPARALPIPNPPPPAPPRSPRSPCSFDSGTATPPPAAMTTNNQQTRRTTSPSRFKRSIRGVRNFFRHCDPDNRFPDYYDDSDNSNSVSDGPVDTEEQQQSSSNHRQNPLAVAVTLTADVRVGGRRNSTAIDMVTTTNSYYDNDGDDDHTMQFLPLHQYDHHNYSNSSSKAYVHYEPSQGLVAVGNNPDTKHAKTLWLTLEQYAWMIRQLQHEQNSYGIVRDMSINYYHRHHPNLISMATTATAIKNTAGSCSTSCLQEQQQQQQQQQQRRPSNYRDPRVAPLIGIVLNEYNTNNSSSGTTQTFNTITRRLSRLMQRAKYHHNHPQHFYFHHNHNPSYRALLLLPKSLLLHAAAYIPVTKPLPPLLIPNNSSTRKRHRQHNHHHQQQHRYRLLDSSFQPVSDQLSVRLYRYVHMAALCMHDLFLDSTSGSLLCRKCSDPAILQLKAIPNTSDISVLPMSNNRQQQQQQPMIQVTASGTGGDATFPITYMHTSLEQRRRTFDSYPPHLSPPSPSLHIAHNTNTSNNNSGDGQNNTTATMNRQHQQQQQPRERACSAIVTDSVIEPFDYSYLLDSTMDNKRGYVAMDDENQEIIVTFPGVPASGMLFENTSFAPVPWQEPLDETTAHHPATTTTAQTRSSSSYPFNNSSAKHHLDSDNAYVLECAVAAWRRCELAVATSLMRICRVAPDDYRVVIIGHSLGGAVAALCASSLVTTGLLVDRPVTLCTIDSPRVGSAQFVEHLAERVETIRLTHVSDIWSQMPPRTSGLLHTGSTTVVILEEEEEEEEDEDDDELNTDEESYGYGEGDDSDSCSGGGRSSLSYMLQTNHQSNQDLTWIEDNLARTFSPYLSPPSPSTTSVAYNNNVILDYPSLWGINLHSTPCRKPSTRYAEKRLCIV